jgi:ubiquinone/menaquinone biosynthesis C-methylase UbiE
MSGLDSKRFKDGERQNWDRVAHGWQKWSTTIEIGAEKVTSRLIELADIKIGSKVLDIATGIGEPAITVASRVGSNGQVLATDISTEMLSIAKQRAANLGLQHVIEFKQGDAETIELPGSTFDAVLCRWGLMLLPNLTTGLSNIYRSLVDGGRLSAAVWASPEKDSLIASTMDSVLKETNSPQPPPGTPGPFSLSDENILRNSFINSAFKDVAIERMNVTLDFGSSEAYANFVHETAGPLQTMLAKQTQDRRQEILESIAESARKYADNNTGTVKLSNEAICIVGRK